MQRREAERRRERATVKESEKKGGAGAGLGTVTHSSRLAACVADRAILVFWLVLSITPPKKAYRPHVCIVFRSAAIVSV